MDKSLIERIVSPERLGCAERIAAVLAENEGETADFRIQEVELLLCKTVCNELLCTIRLLCTVLEDFKNKCLRAQEYGDPTPWNKPK